MIRVLTTASLLSRDIAPFDYLDDVRDPVVITMAFLILFSVSTADYLLVRITGPNHWRVHLT